MEGLLSPVALENSSSELGLGSYGAACGGGLDQQMLHREQLLGLFRTEATYGAHHNIPCHCPSHSPSFSSSCERPPLEEWRRKICQWCFRVIDHFCIDREVVSVGMNIFDRFLAAVDCNDDDQTKDPSCEACPCSCPRCRQYNHNIDSRTFQLSAMTCLYLAIKLHTDNGSDEDCTRRKSFKLSSFVELSRGQFGADDISSMEQVVLQVVSWKVTPPTPMTFVSYLLTLMPDAQFVPSPSRNNYELVLHVIRELSRYLTELAVCLGNGISQYPPSQVAYASILVSMDLLTYKALPLHMRKSFANAVSNLCLWAGSLRDEESVFDLRTRLQSVLWPEMLFDSNCTDGQSTGATDASHPIFMAKEYGLLDVEQIYRQVNSTRQNMYNNMSASAASPPSSPSPSKRTATGAEMYEGSPVSVRTTRTPFA